MQRRVVRTAVAVTLLLLPSLAQAQTPAPEGRVTLEALLAEVRLLRKAIERQNASVARAQLLMGRLTLQDQRVARSRATLENTDRELAGAAQATAALQREAVELQEGIEEAADNTRRSALAEELGRSKARLADHGAATSDLQSRQAQARQALETESARYDEIEALMAALERELDKAMR
jgi:chromosome segregation ATPase